MSVPALASAVYSLLAIVAALRWRRPDRVPRELPPVSILKPMYGTDDHLYEALRSHALQDYPEFEILFGFGRGDDPARADVDRLQREFPNLQVRTIVIETQTPNAKVGVLAELASHARHGLLLVSDDDIVAGPGYLRSVVAPFEEARAGVVTCLYRAPARSLPSLLEGLGIATEFVPSVLVARLLGKADFALGATMALRAETLHEIGGFETLADYLADDYQLGRRVVAHGHRVDFASAIVETGVGEASWIGMWRHQLRWSRTIRVSQRAGYYGSVATQATFWALISFLGGGWWVGLAALALRLTAGALAGGVVLGDRQVWRWFWLLPLRDLFGFVVWLGGCFGSTVYWRGRKLRLQADGRITQGS